MSNGRTDLLLMLSLIAAAAMCFVCLSDDSSAERDYCEDIPPEERRDPRGFMPEPREAVAIDPGHMHDDPFSMVMGFEKVSAEKNHLESQGKDVFVIKSPEMERQPVFDIIMTIIGQDRFLTPEQALSMDFDEVVHVDAVSADSEDDSFLRQVSKALSETDSETARAVDSILVLRDRIRSYEHYQRTTTTWCSSTSDRKDDAEDEEDIENKTLFYEEEVESREPVVFEVPTIQISDGYEEIGTDADNSSAVLMHGAADGPGL